MHESIKSWLAAMKGHWCYDMCIVQWACTQDASMRIVPYNVVQMSDSVFDT